MITIAALTNNMTTIIRSLRASTNAVVVRLVTSVP